MATILKQTFPQGVQDTERENGVKIPEIFVGQYADFVQNLQALRDLESWFLDADPSQTGYALLTVHVRGGINAAEAHVARFDVLQLVHDVEQAFNFRFCTQFFAPLIGISSPGCYRAICTLYHIYSKIPPYPLFADFLPFILMFLQKVLRCSLESPFMAMAWRWAAVP